MRPTLRCTRHDSIDPIRIGDLGPPRLASPLGRLARRRGDGIDRANVRYWPKANQVLFEFWAKARSSLIGLIKLGQGPIGGMLAERLASSDDAGPFDNYVDFSVCGVGHAYVCANRQHLERQLQYYGPGKRVQAASVQKGTAGTMACAEI